jgi:nitrate/nitrite transporter NarK
MIGELWLLQGRYGRLLFAGFAFFLTFVVCFNLAPLAATVMADFGLSVPQIRTLPIANVALTVAILILIRMLLDHFGPRVTYSTLLVYAAIPCLMFAAAQRFNGLVVARLMLSFSGGFEVDGVVLNWRGAIALTGMVSAVYGVHSCFNVKESPPDKVYQGPTKTFGLDITSVRDFWGPIGMHMPFAVILAVGLGIGYLVMSLIKPAAFIGTAGIAVALVITMVCSFSVQAGEGSADAIVPLLRRRLTGQIAGMVGAYGNVDAVAHLTIDSLLPLWLSGGAADTEPTPEVIAASNSVFFQALGQVLGLAGLIVTFLCSFVPKEPKGSFADRHEGETAPALVALHT